MSSAPDHDQLKHEQSVLGDPRKRVTVPTNTPETTRPTTEEIHGWINRAYGCPNPSEPMAYDGLRFTRWNMEAAFLAGMSVGRGKRISDV
jgi:hypothetical protein